MTDTIAYSGWIGENNIGDEAIYLANTKLFQNYQFSNIDYLNERDNVLIGGGTVLPKTNPIDSQKQDAEFVAAIGVGASSPEFWNQRFSQVDLGYYLGKRGHGSVLDSRYVQYLLRPIKELSNTVTSSNHYLSESDFRCLREYQLDYLGVRGPETQSLLSKYNIDSKIVGDTALILTPDKYYTNKQNRICIVLRDGKYQWSKNDNYISTVVDLCNSYSDTYKFIFMPFYPPDISLNKKAAARVENASFIDFCSFMNVRGAINEISKCDLVIGDKLHSNVLAACTYTPFVSLEYRPKNLDFARSVGMEEYNIRTDQVTSANLTEKWIQPYMTILSLKILKKMFPRSVVN
ncbi:polysaccharide pyruvyl transferase family protein [Halorubrum sp. GN12_10-3_MGM]|uniref:polysaccharide pyruvyl transferase family protein n=1 Tax=Halorubrum sp. GN12_10-3_MGM TaxID=2518113 RepID=UPI0010F9F238|nr:polysaccharide pyruvyl transferase family protein [Halorubrum sp. GN12_10-3_MGM]TKX63970.1 hypothetical protein EXE47_13530 [Halorubrum sp. GN12_10-3_MGM]